MTLSVEESSVPCQLIHTFSTTKEKTSAFFAFSAVINNFSKEKIIYREKIKQ
jgi:hypothetical protein